MASLMQELGIKIGGEFKSHRLRLESLDTNIITLQQKLIELESKLDLVNTGESLSSPGSVVQFQSTLFTGTSYNQNINSIHQRIIGLSVSITPKQQNSKIRIDVRWGGEGQQVYNIMFNILRNGVPINLPDVNGTSHRGLAMPSLTYDLQNNASTPETCTFFTVDTHNSTSAITYDLAVIGDGNDTLWTGRVFNSSNTSLYERLSCEITATEIAI